MVYPTLIVDANALISISNIFLYLLLSKPLSMVPLVFGSVLVAQQLRCSTTAMPGPDRDEVYLAEEYAEIIADGVWAPFVPLSHVA